jgi:hypothetical protein
MAQAMAEDGGRVPMSPGLQATLLRAREYAASQSQAQVLLEHLLLALSEDADAAHVLEACQVDLGRLRHDVAGYIGTLNDRVPPGTPGAPAISTALTQVLKYATLAAQQGRRNSIDGAIVLAALVGDGRSMAASFLKAQGLTFEAAIRALREAAQRPNTLPDSIPAALPVETNPSQQMAEAPHSYDGRADGDGSGANAGSQTEAILAQARERIENHSRPSRRDTAPPSPAAVTLARGSPGIDDGHDAERPDLRTGYAGPPPARAPGAPPSLPVPASAAAHDHQAEPEPPRSIEERPAHVQRQPGGVNGHASELQIDRDDAPRTPDGFAISGLRPPSIQAAGSHPGERVGQPHEALQQGAPWAGPMSGSKMAPPEIGHVRPASGQPPPVQESSATPPRMAAHGHSGAGQGQRGSSTGPAAAIQQPWPHPSQSSPPPGPIGSMRHDGAPGGGGAGGGVSTGRPTWPEGPPAGSYPVPAGTAGYAPAQHPPANAGYPPPGASMAPQRRPAVDVSQIALSVPKRMKQGRPHVVEVRIERPPLASSGSDARSYALRSETAVARAIAVRLRPNSGRFIIDGASPETQWDQTTATGAGRLASEAAIWRFTVTPTEAGRGVLQLAVAARTLGADGVLAETQLPDQGYEVRVAPAYGGFMARTSLIAIVSLGSIAAVKLIEGLAGVDLFFLVKQLLR